MWIAFYPLDLSCEVVMYSEVVVIASTKQTATSNLTIGKMASSLLIHTH